MKKLFNNIKICFILILFILNCNISSASDLLVKQKNINDTWDSFSQNKNKAILGIDIGGTKIDWAVYKIENNKLIEKSIISGTVETPKGIKKLSKAYYNIVLNAIKKSGHKNFSIINIGVASPGRFIEYKDNGKIASKDILEKIGNPFVIGNSLFKINENNIIANGTAANLGTDPNEFDGVILESLFQGLSPKHVKVIVINDAAVQFKGLVQNVEDKYIADKKVIYLGFGTGLGTAVMSKNGKIVTDGHFQYITLNKIIDTQEDKDVFDIIRKNNLFKYEKINKNDEIITPEDIFSGLGVVSLLKETLNVDNNIKKIEDILNANKDNINFDLAKNRLKSVGKYLGYFLVNIYNANFKHFDSNSEWSEQDKMEIKNFDTVIIGGGVAKESQFFKELILKESDDILLKNNLQDKINIIVPKNTEITTTYAIANMCNMFPAKQKNIIALTFDDGPHLTQTPKVLDILKKNNVKATFFVIGQNIEKHPDILKRIHNEGHAIAVHTFTHSDLTKLSNEDVALEIQKTIDAIHTVLPKYKIKYMRPPWGKTNNKVKDVMDSFGLKIVLWNVLGNDYLKVATPEYIKTHISSGLKKHSNSVILLHDGGGNFGYKVSAGHKYREGKQNVIDYLEIELPNLVKEYTFTTVL